MDALTVLRREHTRIGQLFMEFDALSECACTGRKALMRELDELVRRHIEMEEALLGEQEHNALLHLLDEIAATECRSSEYISRVHRLRDVLLQHIAEQEAYVFPAYTGSHAA